jgi:CheY-like chemotaxis protein
MLEKLMKKILAADDDEAMVYFYKELLADAGYEMETAPDGAADRTGDDMQV